MPYEYHHGGDICGHPDMLDFSVNINPLGMPSVARAAAERSLAGVGNYPDWKCRELTEALENYYKRNEIFIESENVVWGNGAAELIYTLCEMMALDRKNLRAYIPAPTFSSYEEAVLAVGGTLVNRPEEADLVFWCNPNNPTGDLWSDGKLESLAEICSESGALLCVDESFLPFVEKAEGRSAVHLKHERIAILRSLTKIYAMPGLRLGYLLLPDPETAERLRSLLQPWNVSAVAQAAGREALKDEAYLARTRIYIRKEKDFLLPCLQKAAEKVRVGEANFFFLEAEADLADRLEKKKILIRRCADIRGLDERHFRIGIRTHRENVRLAETLEAM